MNIQKTRFCFYAILLIVLSLLASCIDDNEPVDKQETVTLYVSANMGQTSGLTGTMHDCMLVKEKVMTHGILGHSKELKALTMRKGMIMSFWLLKRFMPIHLQMVELTAIR